MKPFQGLKTLVDLAEADLYGAQAFIEAFEALVETGLYAVDSGAEIVDASADHRGDEYAKRKGAPDDSSDDRLRVAAHEPYHSTRDMTHGASASAHSGTLQDRHVRPVVIIGFTRRRAGAAVSSAAQRATAPFKPP